MTPSPGGTAQRVSTLPTGTVGVGVGSTGQPSWALFTPATSSSIDTAPSALRSKASQAVAGALPSEMVTPRISSLIETLPSPAQSPTQAAARSGAALVLNAAAYTHTSIALYDALATLAIPIIECHLSNPHAREEFRHKSYVTMAAKGVIMGLGPAGYELSLEAVAGLLSSNNQG